MPSPSPSRHALSRRTALVGVVALGTAACTPYSLGEAHRDAGATDGPDASVGRGPDPDVALAATVLAAEQNLVDLLDATVEAHPRLERILAGTRAVHVAHVELLAAAAPADPRTSVAPGTSPGPSSTATPSSPSGHRVPREPAKALRALVGHEDELSLADRRSAFSAESGGFARVLASMAAAAAQQSAVLGAAQVPGGRR